MKAPPMMGRKRRPAPVLPHPSHRQFVRFCAVGLLNTGVDWGLFVLLLWLMHWGVLEAQTIAYVCGVANSFLWNRRVTFGEGARFRTRHLVRFVWVNLASYAVSAAVLYGLSHTASPLWLDKAGVNLLTLILNFSGNKWWVFRSDGVPPSAEAAASEGGTDDVQTGGHQDLAGG